MCSSVSPGRLTPEQEFSGSLQGYPRVTLTPVAGDGGVDVVAIRANEGQLIQCKTSQRSDRELGWDAIKDVVTGEAGYRQQYPGVAFTKVCVATQSFNAGAHAQAGLNNVVLVDRPWLAELHIEHPMTLDEVERLVFCESEWMRSQRQS